MTHPTVTVTLPVEHFTQLSLMLRIDIINRRDELLAIKYFNTEFLNDGEQEFNTAGLIDIIADLEKLSADLATALATAPVPDAVPIEG